jgi:hypothetical protein
MLIALSLAVTVWVVLLVAGVRGYELEEFITGAAFFGVACAFFVVSRVTAGFQSFFEIPVFMTVMAFVMFGAAPISCFLDPDALSPNLRGDTSLLHLALQIVIVGMVAFWLGAVVARSRKPAPAVLDPASLPGSAPQMLTLAFGVGLMIAGFIARVYMLRSGMYGFLESFNVTQTRMAEVQVWIVIEGFGLFALLLFGIEAYYHPKDKVRAGLFWGVLASECLWGLMSGMKRPLLNNLLAVALVSSYAKRKLRLRWFALPILGLIAVYPLMNNYRSIVRSRVTDYVTSVSAATEAMQGAAGRAVRRGGTASDWLASGWSSAVTRLDMTQDVALLLAYRDRSYMLEGDWRLWMIPFYPFVPRFIWRNKPIQNIGGRFTRLLGGQETTCTSPTIPGDLYLLHGGIPGMLAGMFLVGLVCQWLTNPVKLCPSKRNLFIYGCMFFEAANWENDFFAYSTGLIRTFVIVQVLALIIYGPARTSLRSRPPAA